MSQTSVEANERSRNRETTQSDLESALQCIKKRGEKITIASVAREAGVSAPLIHNRYPDFAEKIRGIAGKGARAQRDANRNLLEAERAKNRQLRDDNARLLKELRSLASQNETLRARLRLQEGIASGKVTVLYPEDDT